MEELLRISMKIGPKIYILSHSHNVFFHEWGYPQSSSISNDGMFHSSSYGGYPDLWKPPYDHMIFPMKLLINLPRLEHGKATPSCDAPGR